METNRVYNELATWWPLFSPPEDYSEEAAELLDILKQHVQPWPETVLELGSGGGSLAHHLKSHFTMTLSELSPAMVSVSLDVNPECEHIVADMRTIRLERVFDMVFVHDAIMFMSTEADLRRAIESAYRHCRAGGYAVLVPDFVTETFQSDSESGGHDGIHRALRYLEWSFDTDPNDAAYEVHYLFMLRENGHVTVEHDHHMEGLFARADWLRFLREAGFSPQVVTDSYERDIFIARRPEQ